MPVSIVHKSTSHNKGSCSKYGFYLNKENIELMKDGKVERSQRFFNHFEDNLTTVSAIQSVDDNNKNKGLKKAQDKYFTLTLNLSQKEQKHIAKMVSDKDIKSIEDLSLKQFREYNNHIRDYTRKAMENYSSNFQRNVEVKDIVYYAKIEHSRRFKGFDEEVIRGEKKSGSSKPGLNTHIHIAVSRMHKEYRCSLSPLATARNSKNLVLNGKKIQGGFDRVRWKQLNEESFDSQFQYDRKLNEKFQTLRVLKHGKLQEKIEMQRQVENYQSKHPKKEITL